MDETRTRTPTKVRPLTGNDYDRWGALWQGYLDFYRVTLTEDVTKSTWERLLDPNVDMHGLAAERDETVIGVVHYLFHPVTWSTSVRCYLEDLFVSEGARCTGAGAALIRAVYDAADARGADQVYWLTEEDNHTAQKLYDRVGRKTPFIKYQR